MLHHVASCTVPVMVHVEVFIYITKGLLLNSLNILQLTHLALLYKSILLCIQ